MKNYPFISYSLVFICGILSFKFLPIDSEIIFTPLILFGSISIFSHFYVQNKPFRLVAVIGLYLFFFILGSYLLSRRIEKKVFLSEEINTIEKLVVIGSVQSIDLQKEEELTFEIQTDSIRIKNIYHPNQAIFICRVKDNDKNLDMLFDKLVPGNKVRIEGTFQKGSEARNPGEFDYNTYLHTRGISGLIYVKDEYDVKIIDWNSNTYQKFIFNARKFIDSRINSIHNAQTAGLLRGLILADRSNIDYKTKTEFVNSGVMHILAVSGLHVGYIVLIFIFVLGRFNIILRSLITIVGLIAFLLLTGMPASVFRAVVMAVVIIIAYMFNRSSNIYNSLALAAFVVLIFNPEELFNAGFQLSFLAVLSIAVIYPAIRKFIFALKIKAKILNYLFLFMGVSLSAQIGTLPLTLVYFGKLSLVSLFTNLFVIPLAGFIVGISILTLTLSFFIPIVAGIYASANELIVFVLYKMISFAGSNQYSFIPIKNFTFYDSIIFYIAVVLAILGLTKIKHVAGRIIFIFLVIANAILFSSFDNRELLEKNKLSVMMIDVNRGQATLIKFPNGKTALVNGGYASFYYDCGERIIHPLLNYLDIEKIDYAFVANMTQEKYGGFVSLIKHDLIKNVFKPCVDSTSLVDINFEELIRKKRIPIKYFKRGTCEIGDVKLYFMDFNDAPPLISRNKHGGEVIKMLYGDISFLFYDAFGDEAEYYLIEKYSNFLKADVLNVSIGENNSICSVEFLAKIQPKICLVTVSNRNKFDKPATTIFDRLNKINTLTYRTDEHGGVILQSDGTSVNKINWN